MVVSPAKLGTVSPKTLRSPFKVLPQLNLNVSVAIPARNEEKNLGDILYQLNTLGYSNVLVIDGESIDGTLKVAAENGAKIVMQDGRGKGQAIRQILSNNYLDSEVLVMMDADGSMSPKEVPQFVHAIHNGADVVKGSRFLAMGGSYDITAVRRVGNTIMTLIVNFLIGSKYTDLCYGFVAFNKKAIQMLAPVLESLNFEIETEILIKAKKLGLKVLEVPSIEYSRKNGQSNLNTFRDGFKIIKTIFVEAMKD